MNKREKLPEIRKTVLLNAPIEKVWKAVSTSEGIEAWWMASTLEPILGKEFVIHAGQYGDSPCKITELDPPNCIGFEWNNEWHLTFKLRTLDIGNTEFTLIHSGWNAAKSQVREEMNNGWEKIVNRRLPNYLEV